jgi:hypothetical protein
MTFSVHLEWAYAVYPFIGIFGLGGLILLGCGLLGFDPLSWSLMRDNSSTVSGTADFIGYVAGCVYRLVLGLLGLFCGTLAGMMFFGSKFFHII